MLFAFLALTAVPHPACAFALLGPYADWMQPSNSYRAGWDIGGPMDIHEEYRWNVPVLTYAFDQSFLDYFGSNGVAAVEEAIKLFNDLPAASSLIATNFPFENGMANHAVYPQRLCDLKSATLALLTEQLGLAQPERSMFVLHGWSPWFYSYPDEDNWPYGAIPALIFERNYDPETFEPSHSINGNYYSGFVIPNSTWRSYAVARLIDPTVGNYNTAVADWTRFYYPLGFDSGDGLGSVTSLFLSGWTYDDIGGLRYLLSPENVNLEMLLPDVHGIGANATNFVNLAPRPGVDKITFVPQQLDSLGHAVPLAFQYSDTYVSNGVVLHQQVERVVAEPDFRFCAADVSASNAEQMPFLRSGTSNWWNSASVTGTGGNGPGVIRPPVKITFNRLGPLVATSDQGLRYWLDFHWGSFDDRTNAIVAYPTGPIVEQTHNFPIYLWLLNWSDEAPFARYTWQAPVPYGGSAILQTSSNLVDWVSQASVTNRAGAVTWWHWASPSPKFFRVVPQ